MLTVSEVLPEETRVVLQRLYAALEAEKERRREERRALGVLLRHRGFREVVCRFIDPGPRFAVGRKVLREAGVRLPRKLASRVIKRAEAIVLEEETGKRSFTKATNS
ncbi:hypothetical protein [Ammonifex thiophilus]|uniref:hypothetical protein n=1 Tax=Ammonifex thiophilus TaxID=444093 RepID=UPI00106A478B|nr:hypothetical protein [Ammonifex thiophilus]